MVELGKLMVYIEKQNKSFSLFKGKHLKTDYYLEKIDLSSC